MSLRRNLILAALALTLTACSGESTPSPEPSPTQTSPAPEATEAGGPTPRPSSTYPIPAEEPDDGPTAADLLAADGEVSPYEFLYVQIGAQRQATLVTSTTVDPQWDSERIIHIDRTDPDEPVFYVRTETGSEVTELIDRGEVRWERTGEGEWAESSITPATTLDVHDAAVEQAGAYSSVELISPLDHLFRLVPYDLGMVPALMHVDDDLRPVRVESEGVEGYTVYAYDEPMAIPEVG